MALEGNTFITFPKGGDSNTSTAKKPTINRLTVWKIAKKFQEIYFNVEDM